MHQLWVAHASLDGPRVGRRKRGGIGSGDETTYSRQENAIYFMEAQRNHGRVHIWWGMGYCRRRPVVKTLRLRVNISIYLHVCIIFFILCCIYLCCIYTMRHRILDALLACRRVAPRPQGLIFEYVRCLPYINISVSYPYTTKKKLKCSA